MTLKRNRKISKLTEQTVFGIPAWLTRALNPSDAKKPKSNTLTIKPVPPVKRELVPQGIKSVDWPSSEDEKMFVITCAASFMKSNRIREEFAKRYSKYLTDPARVVARLKEFKIWLTAFEKCRHDYVSNLEEVAGYHKRVRLDRLDHLHDKALEDGDTKEARSAVEALRRETEEQVILSGVSLTLQQINLMSDDEINRKRIELLEFLKKEEQDATKRDEGEAGSDKQPA